MKCEMLSASSVKIYEQCPLRYHAKYELGKKSGSTPQIGAGLIAHKILELYYRPDSKLTKEECFEEAINSDKVSHQGNAPDIAALTRRSLTCFLRQASSAALRWSGGAS